MDNSKTFREELAIQYPTLGRALWEPEPGGLYSAVQVGDVGFIRHGYFTRLFNALSDPQESDPHSRFPNYIQRLQPRNSNHIRTSIDHRKDFCSKNVTNASREPNMSALGPDDDTQVTFSCSGKQGALLYLPFPAAREDTVALGDFGKWIIKNIFGCMRLAEEQGYGVNGMEDFLLVTGRHLARSWVRAIFSESRGGAMVSFVAQVSGSSVIHLEERNASGAQLEFGPNGENLPENQCIFVRGYHVVRILNIWPRLRALAGPAPDLPEPEPEPDTLLQLMGVPADADYRDPLHTLLEYIAEQNPSCDVALVHDDDLKCIENAIPPLETLQPDTLMGSLWDYAPRTRQFQCESFFGNENESEAEVAIATVAMLSLNMFGALHDEGNVSSSIKTTLSGYECPTIELDKLPSPSTASETTASLLQQAEYDASYMTQGPQYYPQTTSYSLPPMQHSTTTYNKYPSHSATQNAQPMADQVSSQYSSQHSWSPVIDPAPASLPYSHWSSTTAQIGSSAYNSNSQQPRQPSYAAFHSSHWNSATFPDADSPLPPSYRSLSPAYPYSSSENNQASSGTMETAEIASLPTADEFSALSSGSSRTPQASPEFTRDRKLSHQVSDTRLFQKFNAGNTPTAFSSPSTSTAQPDPTSPPTPNNSGWTGGKLPLPHNREGVKSWLRAKGLISSQSSQPSFPGSGSAPGNPTAGTSRCSSCKVTTSPEWREGPSGKKDLCNACGLRYARSRAKKEGITTQRRRKDKVMALESPQSTSVPAPPIPVPEAYSQQQSLYDTLNFDNIRSPSVLSRRSSAASSSASEH